MDLGLANLQNAHLGSADLSGAQLRRADLSGADLSEANLQRAIFSNKSELKLARIFDPQLWGAKGAICSKAYVKSPKFGAATGQKAPADPKESANWGQCEASSKRFTEREYRQQLADLLSNIVCNAIADQRFNEVR